MHKLLITLLITGLAGVVLAQEPPPMGSTPLPSTVASPSAAPTPAPKHHHHHHHKKTGNTVLSNPATVPD